MKKHLGTLLVMCLLMSCVFGPTSKKVMSYRNNNVFLSDRERFQVGELPSGWERMRVAAYAIAFHNQSAGATIATDAFCGPAYEDLPLTTLTGHLIGAVEGYSVLNKFEFMLDGRGALRTIARGKVDGVPLIFDVVVLKKNKCNIDFMCIAPEGNHSMVESDFVNFYNGFHYQ